MGFLKWLCHFHIAIDFYFIITFNAFINNFNKVICVSNFCDFNCRHERIHTKKGSYMKSQSQTCDDVEDLATLEVLDEVRKYTGHTRERPQHTHTSIHRLRKDSRKFSILLSDSPFIPAGIFCTSYIFQQHFSERLSSDNNSSTQSHILTVKWINRQISEQ